jgi:sec-independent protein translocase protein TatA
MVVALLLFGPKRLADVGKGLGEGLKNFKKGISDNNDGPDAKNQLTGKDAEENRRPS